MTICGVGKRSLNPLLLQKAQGYERVKSANAGMQAPKNGGFGCRLIKDATELKLQLTVELARKIY